MTLCAHCGREIAGPSRGTLSNGEVVCHTGTLPPQADPPDCYRLTTTYQENLGSRRSAPEAAARLRSWLSTTGGTYEGFPFSILGGTGRLRFLRDLTAVVAETPADGHVGPSGLVKGSGRAVTSLRGPLPDNILAHIRQCVATQHPGAHMAPAWQLAIDHRRWLLAEVDRLRDELADAREEIAFLAARGGEH